MQTLILAWIAAGMVAAATTGVLLARDLRWQLGLMAMQYLGAAVLAGRHWPVGMAAALLVTGWMSIAALGMTLTTLPSPPDPLDRAWPQGRAFRLFMAGMIFVLAAGLAGRGQNSVAGIESPVMVGVVLLIGIGALELGTSSQVTRIVFGLLTVLAGFEVFYATVEGSILVAGLLSVVVLGLGLSGAYLLSAHIREEGP